MFKQFLFLFFILVSVNSMAQSVVASLKRIAVCEKAGLSIEIVTEDVSGLSSVSETNPSDVIVLEKSTSATEVESVGAKLTEYGKGITVELPGYWGYQSINSADCTDISISTKPVLKSSRALPSVHQMKVRSYFVPADVDWKDVTTKLPDLIKKCRAYPILVNILCYRIGATSSALGCTKVEILDDVIPVTCN